MLNQTAELPQKILLGTLLALAGWACFSTGDLLAKLLYGVVNPYEVIFAAGLFGFPLMPVMRAKGQSFWEVFPQKANLFLWSLRAFCFFASTILSVKAFMLLPMAEAMALIFLCPLLTNILTILILKYTVSWQSWLSALLGFLGVLVVLRPGLKKLSEGDFYAIAVTFFLALAVVLIRYPSLKAAEAENALHPMRVESELTVFGSTLFGVLVGGGILMIPSFTLPPNALIWAYLAVYGFLWALAQFFLVLAAKYVTASRVGLAQYSQMIWAVLFGALIFGDRPDFIAWIGISIILLSGCITGKAE